MTRKAKRSEEQEPTADGTARRMQREALMHLALHHPMRERELLTLILECAQHVVGAGGAAIALYDHKHDRLVFRHAVGDGSHNLERYRIPWRSRHGRAFRTKTFIAEVPEDRGADKRAGVRYDNVLVGPLLLGGHPVGTISVVNKANGAAFSDADISTFERFALIAAQVVRQRLVEEAIQQLLRNAGERPAEQIRKMLPTALRDLQFGEREACLVEIVEDVLALADDREEALPELKQVTDALVRLAGGRS